MQSHLLYGRAMDLGATPAHERRKLEAVEDAAAAFERARATYEQARETRDRAVRAAVKAGVAPGLVAQAARLSAGRVSHLTSAPRPT